MIDLSSYSEWYYEKDEIFKHISSIAEKDDEERKYRVDDRYIPEGTLFLDCSTTQQGKHGYLSFYKLESGELKEIEMLLSPKNFLEKYRFL